MSKSIDPSAWKGVTMAVITDPNRGIDAQPLERGPAVREGLTKPQATSTHRPDRRNSRHP